MSISLMTLRLLKTLSLIALVSVPALLPAQTETSGKEEERLEALARSQGEWYTPKSKLSVGFRILSSGGRVDFKNLGVVPSNRTAIPGSDGIVQRVYSNGTVAVDILRSNEKDADGNQISIPGGRYSVFTTTATNVFDAAGNVIGTQNVTTQTGDYLSYTPGLTRQWAGSSASQLDRAGYVSFSNYSTTSDGGATSHKQGPTGGVEFQFAREMGRGSRHLQWSMVAGVTLNDLNSKSAGTVGASLHTYSDYYSLNGQVITAVHLSNPSFGELDDSSGTAISATGKETSVAISAVPDPSISGKTNVVAGGASVTGKWQVKGAYFTVKFGPSVRTQITNRLGFTASVGVAGGYAGTRYTAYEAYSVASLPDVVLDTTEASTAAKFLTGYFADLNLEWVANETLGLYGGVTTQKLSSYEQKLGDRLAKIDLGSSVGIRGGVSIKF